MQKAFKTFKNLEIDKHSGESINDFFKVLNKIQSVATLQPLKKSSVISKLTASIVFYNDSNSG